jgi:Glycosyl hydrolases family 16/Bacterial TSP3 repeat
MSRSDAARTEEDTPMLKWLVLPMAVFAYLAATVTAVTPRDRDHDRLPDRWERNHHLSTTRPSARRDPDSDRLNNRRELRLRTHPRRADTDRDRLRDGSEFRRFHTNPRKRDTDGDGFSDRCELRTGTNPRKRRSRPTRRCSKSPQPPSKSPQPPSKSPQPPPPGGSPPASPGEPSPIAGMGYHQTFRDDFDTLNRGVWDDHIWYDGRPSSTWTNFQYAQNGILHLATSRNYSCGSGCNYPINTVTTQRSGKTFQHGYFEARMKWTKGNGAWPAFWLYSYQHAIDEDQCKTQAGEIDVMEGQGSEPNVLYGTVHSNTNGCAPGDAQNGNNWQPVDADLTTAFHTYAALWTPTTITWYLDDKLIMSAPTYATNNQRMFLLLSMWSGGWTTDPDATTPDVIETQVDWVSVWQMSG